MRLPVSRRTARANGHAVEHRLCGRRRRCSMSWLNSMSPSPTPNSPSSAGCRYCPAATGRAVLPVPTGQRQQSISTWRGAAEGQRWLAAGEGAATCWTRQPTAVLGHQHQVAAAQAHGAGHAQVGGCGRRGLHADRRLAQAGRAGGHRDHVCRRRRRRGSAAVPAAPAAASGRGKAVARGRICAPPRHAQRSQVLRQFCVKPSRRCAVRGPAHRHVGRAQRQVVGEMSGAVAVVGS